MNHNPRLIEILAKIKFIERFTAMSNIHSDMNTAMKKVDVSIILELVKSLGYSCAYNKKHKFFSLVEKSSRKKNSLNFAVTYGKSDFILNLVIDGEKVGGPYSIWTRRCGLEDRIKSPYFSNYDEFNSILVMAIAIFEDIVEQI